MPDRPVMRSRSPARIIRTRRRWSSVSWGLSAIFAVGLLAWTLTYWFDIRDSSGSGSTSQVLLTIVVTDSTTGRPVDGAQVSSATESALTDSLGIARLSRPVEPVLLTISRTGYEPVYGTADASSDEQQAVGLTPSQSVSALNAEGLAAGGSSDSANQSALSQQPPVSDAEKPSNDGNAIESVGVTGHVTDSGGDAIVDAAVLAGSTVVRTDVNGLFELPDVTPGTELRIWASGYEDMMSLASANGDLIVRLQRRDINSVYLTGTRLNDEAKIQELIDLANSTEINAIVVDIKEGQVYYDTGIEFFRDAEAVDPVFDPAALVRRLHDNGIYAIARLVVFNDPVVAEHRSDLAVHDEYGEIWRGYNGAAWVNPFHRELWQPNIDLAVEAAGLGFDEIQYDYVRFPSDGDLTTADFGPNYTEEGRVGAIVDFLRQSRAALEPLAVKLAADIFGIVAVYPEDQGIGQRLADFAAVVDYICPMVYPSHFYEDSIGVDGAPNAFPYETVQIAIGLGASRIPGFELKIRPWLQDFSMGDPPYGPNEVRAQISAAMEEGASGWMLWNPHSDVTTEALDAA
jgi:hypothetical protein